MCVCVQVLGREDRVVMVKEEAGGESFNNNEKANICAEEF